MPSFLGAYIFFSKFGDGCYFELFSLLFVFGAGQSSADSTHGLQVFLRTLGCLFCYFNMSNSLAVEELKMFLLLLCSLFLWKVVGNFHSGAEINFLRFKLLLEIDTYLYRHYLEIFFFQNYFL